MPYKHTHILCEADLAKAEAHVVAYLCQDANMIEAFESGIDVHSFNASKIFDVPIEEVIEEHHRGNPNGKTMRDMGKRVVHACVDKNTEVLTMQGWKKISEHTNENMGSLIAVWNSKTNKLSMESPRHWYITKYVGFLLNFIGPNVDQLVTLNHRIPYYDNDKIKVKTAKELTKIKPFQIPGIITEKERNVISLNIYPSECQIKDSVYYKDIVYCPTVSTGFFLIRRNGKISITGNSNYNMGPQTFSDNLATENTFMSQSECKILLQNYQDRFPGLRRWHKEIEAEVRANRVLYNLFNRPRRFLGMMNAALYRNAYSYKPQSTVAELLNKGMIKMSNDPRLGPDMYDIDMLTTVHDSTVFQFPIEQAKNLLTILQIIDDHMRYTFTLFGRSFTIGLDATIGFRWKGNNAEIARFDQESVDKALEKIGV